MKKFGVILVGLIMLAAGIWLFIKNDNLAKVCTVETEATVIDMRREFSTDVDTAVTSYIYYPIVEFTVDGRTVQATMSDGSSTPAYNFGDKLTILYNPNNTQEFIVKGNVMSNVMSYVVMGIGALVTIGGFLLFSKKNNKVLALF